jgi:hypothetical protein
LEFYARDGSMFLKARAATQGRIGLLLVFLLAGIAIGLSGCQPALTPTQEYRNFLAVGQVKSSYYEEPSTHVKYPLIQGTLTNLGTRKLDMVEFTLRFKNNLQHVIWEEHAYPVYVSEFARPEANQALDPGQRTKFAFKAPKCPPGWEPGFVDIEVSKIAYAKSE